MSKKVKEFVTGRLKELIETAIKIDTEVVEKAEKLMDMQASVAQLKSEGAGPEDVKDSLIEAGLLNYDISLMSASLDMIMANLVSYRDVLSYMNVDMSSFLTEENFKILSNISKSVRPIHCLVEGVIEVSDKSMYSSLLEEMKAKLSNEEVIKRNFDSVLVVK